MKKLLKNLAVVVAIMVMTVCTAVCAFADGGLNIYVNGVDTGKFLDYGSKKTVTFHVNTGDSLEVFDQCADNYTIIYVDGKKVSEDEGAWWGGTANCALDISLKYSGNKLMITTKKSTDTSAAKTAAAASTPSQEELLAQYYAALEKKNAEAKANQATPAATATTNSSTVATAAEAEQFVQYYTALANKQTKNGDIKGATESQNYATYYAALAKKLAK